MSTKLSVNLNKIALLRNSRDGELPDPLRFARLALAAGAAGITVHPRPDERHIRSSDVLRLMEVTRAHPGSEYNIEGNPFRNLLAHVAAAWPDQATFVPDGDDQKTSDHGCDLVGREADWERVIADAHRHGARVSLFMDPVPERMRLARELGADRVELYTEAYALSRGAAAAASVLARYAESAQAAREVGLEVNAGHGLNLVNLAELLRACAPIAEVSIGHALIAESLELGFSAVVARYAAICRG